MSTTRISWQRLVCRHRNACKNGPLYRFFGVPRAGPGMEKQVIRIDDVGHNSLLLSRRVYTLVRENLEVDSPKDFLPPDAVDRADDVFVRGVRLPFIKFNRNPLIR